MFLQIQIDDRSFGPSLDLFGPALRGRGDALGKIDGGIPAVVKEHGYLRGADEVGVFPGVHCGGEENVQQVLRDDKGDEALIGRTCVPGGENSELLAKEKAPDEGLSGRLFFRLHCPIFPKYPSIVNTGRLDGLMIVDRIDAKWTRESTIAEMPMIRTISKEDLKAGYPTER